MGFILSKRAFSGPEGIAYVLCVAYFSCRSTRACIALLSPFLGFRDARQFCKDMRVLTDVDWAMRGHMGLEEWVDRLSESLFTLVDNMALHLMPKLVVSLGDLYRVLGNFRPPMPFVDPRGT